MEFDISSLSRRDKERVYARILKKEQERRLNPVSARSEWLAYENDPVGFIEAGLKEYLWSKQQEICRALIPEGARVAVKSCHSSGKSFLAARIVGWFGSCHKPGDAFIVTSAPTFPQVRAILWRELNRAHAKGNLPGRMNQVEWFVGNELIAFGRKPDDNSMTAFQGLHQKNLLVLLDEACGVASPIWIAADTLIANKGGRMLAIGNPDDPNTEFGNICMPGSGWTVITISAFDTPNLTGEEIPEYLSDLLISREWVEEKKRKWGEESPLYKSKVKGEFPDVSEDSLIAPRYVTAAVDRFNEAVALGTLPNDGPNELGVDVARYGRNQTVIYHRVGSVARLYKAYSRKDTMQTVGWIVEALTTTGAKAVKIDDIGLGGGVVDRLNEIKRDPREEAYQVLRTVQIVPVNVGVPATDRVVEKINGREITAKQRFANLKAEVTWALRDLFVEGNIYLQDDLDTQSQATQIRYEVTSKGLIKIESKEDLEKRLGKLKGATGESGSPDRFDALVLCYADIGTAVPLVITQDILMRSRFAGPSMTPRATELPKSTAVHISPSILARSREK